MGALKRLKKKLTRGGKGGKTFDGTPKARVALGDATRCTRHGEGFWKRRRRKDPRRCCCENAGKKKTATKPFRTADVTTNSALDDTTTTTTTRGGAARFTAVEIFEDEDRGVSTPSIDSPEIEGTSAVVGVVVVFVAEVVLQIGVGRLGGCLGRSWR